MMMQVVFDASRVSINKVLLISQYTFNETAILPKALIIDLMRIKDCENGGRKSICMGQIKYSSKHLLEAPPHFCLKVGH